MNLNLTPKKARIFAIIAALLAVAQIGFIIVDAMTNKSPLVDGAVLGIDATLAIYLYRWTPKPTGAP